MAAEANDAHARLTRVVLERCDHLATLTEQPGRITRTFLSPPLREVHRELRDWMEQLGMRVLVDAAGNLRGRLEGSGTGERALYLGSHLDTVPDAGRYDGVLGVVLALGMLEALDGEALPYPVEVIGFSEEEGVRFGAPFIGSRAFTGTLDEALLARRDAAGVSVMDAIREYGLNPDELASCAAPAGSLGYLEVHIEQGPVLEAQGQPLAVVDAIAGQSRLELTFEGAANHAGTTPMHLRRDALAGAAEFVLTAEESARRTPGLVATVGRLQVRPGAGNVVPGNATLSLDVRHAVDAAREQAVRELLAAARETASKRELSLASRTLLDQPAVPMDRRLTGLLRRVAPDAPVLTSGAGHDAMIVAPHVPSALLFVRSPGGISHHPDERVLEADVRAALRAGVAFLRALNEEVRDA